MNQKADIIQTQHPANAKIETINCNVCGSSSYKPVYSEAGWTVVKCGSCGHCFTNPRPTSDSLHLFYEEDYFKDERHYNKFYNADGTPKIENVSSVYNNRVSDVEGFVTARGELLDIGAARGAFIYKMKLRGWNVQGVEISQDAVTFGTKAYSVPLFCGTADEFQPQHLFDVITMYQTLEHIANPVQVVNRCFQWLKPGGVLVVEVPNRRGVEMMFSQHRRHLSYDLPRHLNHFSPDILQRIFKQASFEVVYRDFFYPKLLGKLLTGSRSSGIVSNQSVAASSTNLNEKPLERKPTGLKHRLLRKVTTAFPGWRMTFIGRKPLSR